MIKLLWRRRRVVLSPGLATLMSLAMEIGMEPTVSEVPAMYELSESYSNLLRGLGSGERDEEAECRAWNQWGRRPKVLALTARGEFRL
jgi:hypothetical protein